MIYKSIFSSPLGYIEICADGGESISRVYFTSTPSTEYTENSLTQQAAAQLGEYFKGERKTFDVPLAPAGSGFEKEIWDAICRIPYGEQRTYKELAAAVGDDKAVRKAGQATDACPIAVLIPTHRVKGKASFLATLSSENAVKEAMLGMEKKYK